MFWLSESHRGLNIRDVICARRCGLAYFELVDSFCLITLHSTLAKNKTLKAVPVRTDKANFGPSVRVNRHYKCTSTTFNWIIPQYISFFPGPSLLALGD